MAEEKAVPDEQLERPAGDGAEPTAEQPEAEAAAAEQRTRVQSSLMPQQTLMPEADAEARLSRLKPPNEVV